VSRAASSVLVKGDSDGDGLVDSHRLVDMYGEWLVNRHWHRLLHVHGHIMLEVHLDGHMHWVGNRSFNGVRYRLLNMYGIRLGDMNGIRFVYRNRHGVRDVHWDLAYNGYRVGLVDGDFDDLVDGDALDFGMATTVVKTFSTLTADGSTGETTSVTFISTATAVATAETSTAAVTAAAASVTSAAATQTSRIVRTQLRATAEVNTTFLCLLHVSGCRKGQHGQGANL
jgi:hypothetical protein